MGRETPNEGLTCPKCFCRHFLTVETTKTTARYQGKVLPGVRRRRVCRHCRHVVYTFEVDEGALELNGFQVLPAKYKQAKTSPKEETPDVDPPNPYL